MPPRKKPEMPDVPATPESEMPAAPATPVIGPVKVRHKQSGQTFVVSKEYFSKYGERLEIISE